MISHENYYCNKNVKYQTTQKQYKTLQNIYYAALTISFLLLIDDDGYQVYNNNKKHKNKNKNTKATNIS